MLDDLHDADALLRAGRWLADRESFRRGPPSRHFDEARRLAFAAYFEGKSERSANLCDALRAMAARQSAGRPAPAPERFGQRAELLAHTVEVEGVWGAHRKILAERESPAVGEPLQHADSCAWDIYATFFRSGGVPGRPEAAELAPPTVTLGGVAGPLMFPRATAGNADGFARDLHEIPIPIVVLPAQEATAVWAWTALAHEIGHVIDQKLDLAFTAEGELHRAMRCAPLRQRLDWAGWLREIVADALGLLLGGEGFAWTLMLLFDRTRSWRQQPSDDLYHPAPVVRASLIEHWLAARGASDSLRARLHELASAGAPGWKKEVAPEHLREAEIVADLVLRTPLAALGGRSLESTAPDAAADRDWAARMVSYLTGGGELSGELLGVPRRLIPGAAQLAVVDAAPADQATLERVRDRALLALARVDRPAWLTPPADFEFLRTEAREHQATTLDQRTNRKVPPAELLARHDSLAFVGATNDQLATSLKAAFEARKKERAGDCRWTQIDVFFLAPLALSWMTVADRDEDASAEGPDTSERAWGILGEAPKAGIAELRACLPGFAVQWNLFEYDAPFYFAAYFDADRPGGRIHASPAIWGKDIRDCPADDYLRGEEAPSAKYRAYLEGLTELRKKARRLGGGEPLAVFPTAR